MMHFSCDVCGADLSSQCRYVVKMEVYPAPESDELTEDDLDTDALESLAAALEDLEQGLAESPTLHPTTKKLRFDLCPKCRTRFLRDPLRREAAVLKFSKN